MDTSANSFRSSPGTDVADDVLMLCATQPAPIGTQTESGENGIAKNPSCLPLTVPVSGPEPMRNDIDSMKIVTNPQQPQSETHLSSAVIDKEAETDAMHNANHSNNNRIEPFPTSFKSKNRNEKISDGREQQVKVAAMIANHTQAEACQLKETSLKTNPIITELNVANDGNNEGMRMDDNAHSHRMDDNAHSHRMESNFQVDETLHYSQQQAKISEDLMNHKQKEACQLKETSLKTSPIITELNVANDGNNEGMRMDDNAHSHRMESNFQVDETLHYSQQQQTKISEDLINHKQKEACQLKGASLKTSPIITELNVANDGNNEGMRMDDNAHSHRMESNFQVDETLHYSQQQQQQQTKISEDLIKNQSLEKERQTNGDIIELLDDDEEDSDVQVTSNPQQVATAGFKRMRPSESSSHKLEQIVPGSTLHGYQYQAQNNAFRRNYDATRIQPIQRSQHHDNVKPNQASEPRYINIPSNHTPTWNNPLAPILRLSQNPTLRSNQPKHFELSLLNLSEFTITGLPLTLAGLPSSVLGFRKVIKEVSRSHGKAIFERDNTKGQNKTTNSRDDYSNNIENNSSVYLDGGKWRIPLGAYRAFYSYLKNDNLCQVKGIPEDQLKIASLGKARLEKGFPSVEKIVSLGVPKGVARALAPFQRGGVDFVLEKFGRALIADDMGLGKTVQAIASMSVFHDEWPLLILTPSSARYHWENEFQNWLGIESRINDLNQIIGNEENGATSIIEEKEDTWKSNDTITKNARKPMRLLRDSEIHVVLTGKGRIFPNDTTRIVICSYGLATSLVESGKIYTGLFKCAIVDESHMLKNIKTKRTSKLVPILHATNRCILLSGTPALAHPSELWPQLKILSTERDGWWDNEDDFVRKYVQRTSAIRRAELHTMLTGTVMIRRMKQDMLKSLPNKKREKVKIDVVNDTMREEFSKYMKLLREGKGVLAKIAKKHETVINMNNESPGVGPNEKDSNGKEFQDVNRKSILHSMYTLTAKSKVPSIARLVEKWLADPTKGKLCIFAHHVFVLDEIIRLAGLSNDEKHNRQFIRIDGSTLPKDRQRQINAFQSDSSIRVAILGITAAGVAVTLTASSTVWFAELFWTPALMIQAEDRCHRIGQNAVVKCLYFVASGTLDVLLWDLLEKKFRDLGEFVEGKEKMKIVVDYTYESMGEIENALQRSDEDDYDDDVKLSNPKDSEGDDFIKLELDLQEDIVQLANEEMVMISQADDEDGTEMKVIAKTSSIENPTQVRSSLGQTEDEAICLSEDDDETSSSHKRSSTVELDSSHSVVENCDNGFINYNDMSRVLSKVRYYQQYFEGKAFGIQLILMYRRLVVANKRYGESKPALGDVLVAINGYRLPIDTLLDEACRYMRQLLIQGTVELTFLVDNEFSKFCLLPLTQARQQLLQKGSNNVNNAKDRNCQKPSDSIIEILDDDD